MIHYDNVYNASLVNPAKMGKRLKKIVVVKQNCATPYSNMQSAF